jgi:hemerythrin
MPFMEWTDQFSVGVAVFDDEHKKLIAIINTLYDSVAAGADKLALQRVCDDLVDYTISHFRHEEEYFEEWGYPDAKDHVASHEALRRQVFEYRNRIRSAESSELASELLRFLREWLARHIMIEDRTYGHFLTQKGFR